MIKYREVNVNPKHRKTGDCATRALVGVLGLPYDECLKMQFRESLKRYYDPTSKQVMERVLAKYGYVKMKMPKRANGKRYTVLCADEIPGFNKAMEEGVLITLAGHYTVVKNGYCEDIWDCRDKSIGNYYVKA